MSKINTTKQKPSGYERPPFGGGKIPSHAYYARGVAIRDIRVREGVTLRELSESLEVDAVVFTEIERGASHLDTIEDYQLVISTIKEIASIRGERA